MEPLSLSDILSLDDYERVRSDYRAKVIAHKKTRRVSVGPQVSLVFEDRETLRYQIQEMTRVERTTRADRVQLEVDVYNELVPGPNELSATLFIEIPELDEIQPALDRLLGIDAHVHVVVGDEERITARFDDRQMEADRISAVHYLRFTFTPEQGEAFRNGPAPRIRIDHRHYDHEVELSEPVRASLAADLGGTTPSLLDPATVRAEARAATEVLLETPLVRALRISPEGPRETIVVEPASGHVSLLDAEPPLLDELFRVTRQVASELRSRRGSARVRLDVLAQESGALRFEITTGS